MTIATLDQKMETFRRRLLELEYTARSTRQPAPIQSACEDLFTVFEELRVAEEELRQQNEELIATRQTVEAERQRYQELFDFAPDGYLVTDAAGQIQAANLAAGRLLSLPCERLVGIPIQVFASDADRRRLRLLLIDLARSAQTHSCELQLKSRDKRSFPAALSVAVIRDQVEPGQPVSLRWLIRDMTERRQAEAALRESHAELAALNAELRAEIAARKRFEAKHPALAMQNARLFQQAQAARERLQVLTRQLIQAQETEHRRIARELHDEIGQALTAVKIDLQGAQHAARSPALKQRLDDGVATVEHALQQVRGLSRDLRPSLLDEAGLVAALRWYVDRQAQRGRFAARFVADAIEPRPAPEIETICFRVAQEALTNIVKHAQAQQVEVALRTHATDLELTIRDNGLGFDVRAARAQAKRGTSLGLLGMEERVLLGNGRIDIVSAPGQGSLIQVRLPLNPATTDRQPAEGDRHDGHPRSPG
ncbi:MAG TPA: PAS domain-containing sensor histidine kinase [Anaerolineae bacterium]|nr:PAS domain-containing sensor histidine kinase [Anaerolineae bacterium]